MLCYIYCLEYGVEIFYLIEGVDQWQFGEKCLVKEYGENKCYDLGVGKGRSENVDGYKGCIDQQQVDVGGKGGVFVDDGNGFIVFVGCIYFEVVYGEIIDYGWQYCNDKEGYVGKIFCQYDFQVGDWLGEQEFDCFVFLFFGN